MKQILLSFLLALLPLVASADAVEIDSIYYNLIPKGKVAEVTSNPNKYTGAIEIPETVTYDGVICNVTSIGESAFSNCSGLTSVTIPNSLTSIGAGAFNGCSGLKEVHITDLAKWCQIKFENNGSNPLYEAHHLYLNKVVIKDLAIPNSVTNISDNAFWGCSDLSSVTIPNSVTSIGSSAFWDCSGLTSVTIPNSVTSIGGSAFSRCSGLKEVHITDLEKWCQIKFENNGSNPLNEAHHLYLNTEEIKDLDIPSSIASIGNYVFNGCSDLTSVTIPNSITSIGSFAFGGCI